MKHLKQATFLLVAILMLVFAAGCAGSNSSSKSTGAGKGNVSHSANSNVSSHSNDYIYLFPGEDRDFILHNNKITKLDADVTDTFRNGRTQLIYYVMDGTLYLCTGSESKAIDSCVEIIHPWPEEDTACLYRANESIVKLYNPKTGKAVAYPISTSIEYPIISPDGMAFAYIDPETNKLVLCREGECLSINPEVDYGHRIMGVSNNGELVYVTGIPSHDLYCYSATGEKTLLYDYDTSENLLYGLEFNADYTQVLVSSENITYISENGKPLEVFADGEAELIANEPVKDLYGQLYKRDGALVRIERNSDDNCVLLSADDILYGIVSMHRTGDQIIYCNHQREYRYISVNGGENAAETSTLIYTDDTSDHDFSSYFSDDLSCVYQMAADSINGGPIRLKRLDSSKTIQIHEFTEGELPENTSVYYPDDKDGIYYTTADALYYFDGNTSTKIVEGVYYLPKVDGTFIVCQYAADEDVSLSPAIEAVYLLRNDHTLQKLPVDPLEMDNL